MSALLAAIAVFGGLVRTSGAAEINCDSSSTFDTHTTFKGEMFLNVTNYNSIVLDYVSCGWASISVSSEWYFPNSHLIAYFLRLDYNYGHTLYQCHDCATNTVLDMSPVWTMNGFNCAVDPLVVWIMWDSDSLVVGEGNIPGSSPLVWTEPLLHPINYLGFSSGTRTVTWRIRSCTAVADVPIPDVTRVTLPSAFTLRKPSITHLLDASSVTSLVVNTRTCYTMFLKAAATEQDVTNTSAISTFFSFNLGFTSVQVNRLKPYYNVISNVPNFGGICSTADFAVWINWTGDALSMGLGDDGSSSPLFENFDLQGVSLNFFGFSATYSDFTPVNISTHSVVSSTPSSQVVPQATIAPAATPGMSRTIWQKLIITPGMSVSYYIRESVNIIWSDIGCGRECMQRSWCSAFHYDSASSKCHLLESSPSGPAPSLAWIYKLV